MKAKFSNGDSVRAGVFHEGNSATLVLHTARRRKGKVCGVDMQLVTLTRGDWRDVIDILKSELRVSGKRPAKRRAA